MIQEPTLLGSRLYHRYNACGIASGSLGQAATTTAKSVSVLQVPVGKWWATVC